MYLRIANKGEIELAALFLIGASTKEGDSSKIGFFGSGNKYAIATLLRKHIGLRIFSGTREVVLATKHVDFRGEAFDQILIDDAPTSFTTRMGPTWETWFALREFICNAIDEGGFEFGLTADAQGTEGETAIFVDYAPEVARFFGNIDDYIFLGEPVFEADSKYGKVAITNAEAPSLNVYRKGVCVTPTERRTKGLFHYNFAEIDINESRVFIYEYQVRERIAWALSQAPTEIVQRFVDSVSDQGTAEYRADWSDVTAPFSSAWEEVLRDAMIIREDLAHFAPIDDILNAIILPDDLVKKLEKQWPTLHVWGAVGAQYREVEYEGDAIERARAEVESFGYWGEGFRLKTVIFAKDGVMASVDKAAKMIAVDVRYVEDYDELITTLVEETSHLRGYADGTRHFEQYLMRELVKAKREAAK